MLENQKNILNLNQKIAKTGKNGNLNQKSFSQPKSGKGATTNFESKLNNFVPLQIQTPDGGQYNIQVLPDWTVRRLKEEFGKLRGDGPAQLVLSLGNRNLVDSDCLKEYKIEPGSKIFAFYRTTIKYTALRFGLNSSLPLKIQTMNGKIHSVEAYTNWTVKTLKEVFDECREDGNSVCELIFRGRVLCNNYLLIECNIMPDSIIQATI